MRNAPEMPGLFGSNPDEITAELEQLKVSLIALKPEDLAASESNRIAAEISAIRLQLKRLEADREWVKEVAARATRSDD